VFIADSLRLSVDRLAQFLARLEVRRPFRRHIDRGTGRRIAANPWRPMVQAEYAESPNLDSTAGGNCIGDTADDYSNSGINIAPGQFRESFVQEFG